MGAICGGLAVGLGAFGAHALHDRVEASLLGTWETATSYLGLHAVALLVCGLALSQRPGGARLIDAAAWSFLIGSLLFSGSLYLLVLSGVRAWGAVTPVGGITLIVGWVLLAAGAWSGPSTSPRDEP